MRFMLNREWSGDGRTFSEEAILSYLFKINEWLNETVSRTIYDGFNKNNPIDSLDIELVIKANGNEINPQYLEEKYGKVHGFDATILAKKILEKGGEIQWETE